MFALQIKMNTNGMCLGDSQVYCACEWQPWAHSWKIIDIEAHLTQNPGKLELYHRLKEKNDSDLSLKLDPTLNIGWNGQMDETVHANIIMGAIS